MSAQIPGNPHYENLARFNGKSMTIPELDYMQAQATLALAYEQRTANLIAHISLIAQASELDFDDDVQAANREILTRLGINEGATK